MTSTGLRDRAERKLFEAWFEADVMPAEADWFRKDANGEYDLNYVGNAWWAWKARAALLASPADWRLQAAEHHEHQAALWDTSEYGAKETAEHEKLARDYRAMIAASPAPAGAEGWVLVPEKPTEDMLNAARDWSIKKNGRGVGDDQATGCFQAMLAASPAPAQATEGEPVDLRNFGYAPGGYLCKCADCPRQFDGDKRAWRCQPCAVAASRATPPAEAREPATEGETLRKPRFEKTGCSQCGREFGPGDHGYSHCDQHQPPELWIPDLIRNDYDKAPDHYAAGDNWDDGADEIARKIVERFADRATPAPALVELGLVVEALNAAKIARKMADGLPCPSGERTAYLHAARVIDNLVAALPGAATGKEKP